MKITRFFGLAAFAAASLLLAGSSQAAFVPLPSNLGTLTTAGNFTTVGDKTFTFLSYSNTQNPAGSGNPIGASSVAVTALSGNPAAPVQPFGFQLSGPIIATPNTVNSNDIALTYTVSSSGGPITAVNLFANGSTTGSGFAEVVESVFVNNNGVAGAFLGQIAVIGSGSASLSLGAGFTSLFIVKDIQFDVLGPGPGTATYSVIQQTFTQVPEPASVVMMGLGLVGAIGVVRLRRKPVVA